MALANYDDLVDSVNARAGWLHRDDLATIVPDWIALAEQTINNGDPDASLDGLRTGSQETLATGTLTVGSQTLALPTGFLEMRRFYIIFGGIKRELPQRPITPMSLAEASQVTALPSSYWVIGSNIYLDTFSDQAYQYVMDYYAKVGPLTSSSSTNWLLTSYPMVYLFGTIAHGALWLGAKYIETAQAQGFLRGFRSAMAGVTRADRKRRYGNTLLRSEAAQFTGRRYSILTGGFT